ncbi:MAG: hypothetical protein IKU84_03650 [Clostridia bacterium]|nr:hypothetical protein [Clostridia bacterium]
MLFNKDIQPCCAYCLEGSEVNEDTVVCKRHGVVLKSFRCRHYKYNPFNRTPPSQDDIELNFSENDFSINPEER